MSVTGYAGARFLLSGPTSSKLDLGLTAGNA